MKARHFLFSFLVVTVVAGVAIGLCVVALVPGARQIALAHKYTADVPPLRELSLLTTVYDTNGNVLGRLGTDHREPVELDEVPKVVQNAVIATEDQSFWTNPGFDIGGSTRALFENLGSGRIEQGGSTITQQLVKIRLLDSRQDVNRKIREMVLAYRLTERYSKRQILEFYLNTVYFGQGSYGVKSAAERFFKDDEGNPKPLAELNIGEAALLAGVIRSPSADNPWDYPERAKIRQVHVLEQMVDEDYITPAEAEFFEAIPLQIAAEKPPSDRRPDNAWVEQAQTLLLNDPRLGSTEEQRRKKVLQGGLKVYTTKDPRLQHLADEAVASVAPTFAPGFDATLVAMDPRNGYVRAMTDSKPYSESQFNYAVDGAGQQVGSSFKVVTLTTLLANDYSPNDEVDGSSGCRLPSHPAEPPIANAGGGGRMSLRRATAGSVNCAFVNASGSVGLDKVADMASRLGVRTDVDGRQPFEQWRVPTLTLGVVSVTPVEMATVGATLASGGERHDPIFVWKVEDSKGRVIFDETNRPGERVVEPDVAACAVDVLHGPFGPDGTAEGLAPVGQDAFGKTGTNDRKISAAFLGATPELAAFVWHGDAENPDNPPSGGQAGFGAEKPGTIWSNFMNAAFAGTTGPTFPPAGAKCNAPGKFMNPGGGRTGSVAPPPRPTVPVLPGGQQQVTPSTLPGGILPPATVPQTVPPNNQGPSQPQIPLPNLPFPIPGFE